MSHPFPKDYNQSIKWARNVLQEPLQWVILDTETTGLGKDDVVIQLSIIDLNANPLIDTLLKPLFHVPISDKASAVHGITEDKLSNAPNYINLYNEIAGNIAGKNIIAYNVDFDRKMLKQTALKENAPTIKASWQCAMIQYARFIGKWSDFRKNYTYQRLPSRDHTALGDCLATLEIIRTMANASLK